MARIEWIKLRLDNWAAWKEREASGARGWYRQSPMLNTVTLGGYRECIVPINDMEAMQTNAAVESLRMTRSHLFETLHCIYPLDLGIRETARRMGRAESTISAHLAQADLVLALWFEERAQKKKSFTT